MPKIRISRQAYRMASDDGKSAEVVMYGEVVESRPIHYGTGEPMEGDFICQDEFLEDLKKLAKCKSLTLRLNSLGGDAAVGITIHNRLRELVRDGVELKCIVDGVAMSAGSIIMCASDHVSVNRSSIVMIHGVHAFLFGEYNVEDMQKVETAMETYNKAAVAIYVRKTGLSEDELSSMMSETTYMTGAEAVDKGFADELLEGEGLAIAASADGRRLIVNGHSIHLSDFAPDNIPTIAIPTADTQLEAVDKPDEGIQAEEEITMTLDELKAKYPELCDQLRAESDAASIAAAVKAERARLSAIDEIADLLDSADVQAAKYGESMMTAEQLLMQAAKKAKAQGRRFLQKMEEEYQASGASEVGAASNGGVEPLADFELSAGDVNADVKHAVSMYLGKEV